ncbi:hypothetical protein Y032_0030g2057 [Ancylostoma ceylanicum]|uniref:Uncharacterized protein n=1 Tax=Ancylostoma ceylanicum TaxID=53326 RepID=A0A016UQI6_9BILA|nr:hypothetical protein Y032_0030g2057 [Ancylostoma ceylanicum]
MSTTFVTIILDYLRIQVCRQIHFLELGANIETDEVPLRLTRHDSMHAGRRSRRTDATAPRAYASQIQLLPSKLTH